MHSRIFQISFDPIEKKEYIVESNYWDHWFVREIADYVNGNTDRDDDIKWLEDCCDGFVFGKDDDGEYFIVENKEEYFKEKFERFMQTLDKIKNYTLKDFTNGFFEMWTLKDAYEDKFGFYVDADGELMNLDDFVRGCAKGEKYYIGGTIDYHW
jgi:hypothetical protein